MKPRVILHNAVSLDSRVDSFPVDLGLYYGLVSRWNEDATLVGSETILKAPAESASADAGEEPALPENAPGDGRPLLVVPDSRGRVTNWGSLRRQPYWRDAVVLVSKTTPRDYVEGLERLGIDRIEAGDRRVDFRRALEELNARYGAATVRVDSGGALNGVLLRAGLVDEVSLLLYPCLVGEASPAVFFRDPAQAPGSVPLRLALTHREEMGNGVLWLRYDVIP